jgi:hypothetical protein
LAEILVSNTIGATHWIVDIRTGNGAINNYTGTKHFSKNLLNQQQKPQQDLFQTDFKTPVDVFGFSSRPIEGS